MVSGSSGVRCGVMAVWVTAAALGCAPEDFTANDSRGEHAGSILRGTEARDRPEACVVETSSGRCSGTLVASNVVLTAGHCVAGSTLWRVSCPYSNDTATVTGSQSSITPNYPNRDDPDRDTIDNNQGSDLGLIRLDRALRETRVARVSFARVTVNTRVYAIGRVNNGDVTAARLFRSPVFALTAIDRRNGYWAGVDQTVIEGGDSGGGLFDESTGQLLGVNSAGIDAQFCRRGSPCDEWALLSASTAWFQTNLQRFTEGVSPPPPPPSDPCAASTDCAACTALPACGWCDNRCSAGSASGGATCTSAAGTWAWTSSQCQSVTPPPPPPPPPPPTDACASSLNCATCTARAQCGWCDGRCQSGSASGPSGATCAAAWAWLSRQCM